MSTDWLDQLVGEWTYEASSVPDQPDQRRTGEETVTRHGAWIVIEGDGYRFQLAFNAETGRVVGDFVHWEHPHLWPYDGAVEADGKLHLPSRGPTFDDSGGETDYDDVFEILSVDTRRTTGRFRDPDGQWRDFTVTDYRRKA